MAYGKMTQVASGGTSQVVNIVKELGGPHDACHTLLLHNNGAETVYFNYNLEEAATVAEGYELTPGLWLAVVGSEGEQIKRINHITGGLASTFKWSKSE